MPHKPMDWWQEQELDRHKRERQRQQQMAAFNSDYTFTYPDYNFTTSATSVYYGVPYSYDSQPLVKTLPQPEPEVDDGLRGWLDAELNEIMLLGRAEPVLA